MKLQYHLQNIVKSVIQLLPAMQETWIQFFANEILFIFLTLTLCYILTKIDVIGGL